MSSPAKLDESLQELPYAWRRVVLFADNMAQAKVADAIGRHPKQQLTWIGLAAMPLLLPFGIPGVATSLGYLTFLLGLGYALGFGMPIPRSIGEKRLPPGAVGVLKKCLGVFIRRVAPHSKPRLYVMSHPRMRPVRAGAGGLRIHGTGCPAGGAVVVGRLCRVFVGFKATVGQPVAGLAFFLTRRKQAR